MVSYMGFLDSILGESTKTAQDQGETKVLAKPFKIATSFTPLRLSANKKNSVNLIVKVTNLSNDPQLVSVDVALPKSRLLGFEPTCINKACEKRVGTIQAGETTEVAVPVWGNNQTQQGSYPMEVTVYAHYQDYKKVLNYMKKLASLRVV